MLSVWLLLQPKHFKYKKKQKKRTCLVTTKFNTSLRFGSSGLLTLQPLQLTGRQISRFKLFFKKASKKGEKTQRFVWLHVFPHLPLTRKPNGVRMGKGKGKLECWITSVPANLILVELKNLRKGRAKYFMNQLSHKLPIVVKQLFAINYFFSLPLHYTKRINFRVFW